MYVMYFIFILVRDLLLTRLIAMTNHISSINSEQETNCQYKYLMSIIWEFTLIFILVLYLHFNTYKAGSHAKLYNKHQQWAGSKMSKYDLRHNQLTNQGHRSAMLILKSYWKLDSMNGFVCFSSFLYFHALFCLVIFLSLWVHSCLWFKVYIMISCPLSSSLSQQNNLVFSLMNGELNKVGSVIVVISLSLSPFMYFRCHN